MPLAVGGYVNLSIFMATFWKQLFFLRVEHGTVGPSSRRSDRSADLGWQTWCKSEIAGPISVKQRNTVLLCKMRPRYSLAHPYAVTGNNGEPTFGQSTQFVM